MIFCCLVDLENHHDLVQSFFWKGDGSLLVTSSRVSVFRSHFVEILHESV